MKFGPSDTTERLIGLAASQGEVAVLGVSFANQTPWNRIV
jgi:hypothetical protein